MAEKTTYEQKGTLREECMQDTAMPDGFRPLESDWRELLRWLMSVSGNLPYYDRTDKENGRLSSLWENHVLTVLVDILQKDVCGYVDSFVDGRGTSAQTEYTNDLKDKFTGWAAAWGNTSTGAAVRQRKALPWKWQDSCSNNWRKPFPGIRNPAQNLSSPR